MTPETLRSVMLDRISIDLARAMLPHYTAALLAAGCTTVNRAAMFGAQVGHESASLRYMEEIASGAAYEGRADLGNTRPGDGRRFKGRGPIQLTGRYGYTAFSQWCYARGLVSTPTYFVDHPTEVAAPRWGFLAASHYWVVRRPKINGLCDRGDLDGVTRQINGGLNGIADRRVRWEHCRRLGDRLLPGAAPAPPQEVPDMDATQSRQLAELHAAMVQPTIVSRLDGRPYDARTFLSAIHSDVNRWGGGVAAAVTALTAIAADDPSVEQIRAALDQALTDYERAAGATSLPAVHAAQGPQS